MTGQPQPVSPSGDPDWSNWPPATDGEARRKIFDSKVEARVKRIDQEISRAQANRNAVLAQDVEFHKALLDVAKGGIDRARGNAETVQKAAGAIGVLYTGVLGAAFSVTSRPLPVRGVLPAVFLGLSVALATAYLAYLSGREAPGAPAQMGVPEEVLDQFDRVTFLVTWIRRSVSRRAWLLRSSVIGLAVGVMTLPLPFVTIPSVFVRPSTLSLPIPRVVVGPPSPVALPDWPTPSPTGDAELEKIRYQAEVNEAAHRRQVVQNNASNDALVLGMGIFFGLALMAIGEVASRLRR